MKRAAFVVILTAMLLTITGCPEFFTFNIYDGLDPVFPPDKAQLDEMGTDEALEFLEEEIGSDSFIDALVQDEENTPEGENSSLDDVKNYLADIYNNTSASTEDRSTAAVLAADLELAATGADEVINNFLKASERLTALSEDSSVTEEDVKAVFEELVPAEMVNDEQAFKDMIDGIFSAAAVYDTLGSDGGILSTGDDGDIVTGGVFLNAAVTTVIDQLTSDLVNPGEDRADVLWDIMQGEDVSSRITTIDFAASDPFANPTITNIADAAEIDPSTFFPG